VSPHGAGPVALTLAIFVVVYFTVFGAGTWYGLKIIAKGPETGESQDPVEGGPGQPRTPARPLSAAPEKEKGSEPFFSNGKEAGLNKGSDPVFGEPR
jgi:cytochrome d ubiquinol oxidase subunit I